MGSRTSLLRDRGKKDIHYRVSEAEYGESYDGFCTFVGFYPSEEGYEFGHPPSIEDFEAQLERSIDLLNQGGGDALFDRCPVDIIAYLLSHEDAALFAVEAWLPNLQAALEKLDLIVFVPVEVRDRIPYSVSDDSKGDRLSIDEKLRELLLDDSLGFGLQVLCVG